MSSRSLALLQMPSAWHHRGTLMGLHWIWWLFWVLTVCLVIWALWRELADRRRSDWSSKRAEAAEEALRARFARGEISEQEYVRMLHVLRDTIVPH